VEGLIVGTPTMNEKARKRRQRWLPTIEKYGKRIAIPLIVTANLPTLTAITLFGVAGLIANRDFEQAKEIGRALKKEYWD
jgi:hypothetical protein